MKIYCQKCGKPAIYSGMEKPNFCSSCGFSFSSLNDQKDGEAVCEVSRGQEEYDDDVTTCPDIDKLDVSIIHDSPTGGVKLEDLVGTSNLTPNLTDPKSLPPQISQEEFLKSFKKEAGSLRDRNAGNGEKES